MSEEFEQQMLRFNIVVQLGDFSNNNSGPKPVSPELLESLFTINPEEMGQLMTFGLQAMAVAEELYSKSATVDPQQNPPQPEAIKAIVIFDKVDAFIRALPCLDEIYKQFGFSSIGRLFMANAVPLEKALLVTVRKMVDAHMLNGRIAKQALAKSERRTQTRIFPWIRDLLIHYQPAAYLRTK